MPDPLGDAFQQAELVKHYIHRPPYASQVYDHIVARSGSTNALLDLGCGEGKIARPMARIFDSVTAVDPSANMIALGKSLEGGQADNLTWVEATAEDATLSDTFDVVTFASSIHWMTPATLFPKLATCVSWNHILAFVSGDEAFEPPWHDEWRRFLGKWVPAVTGQKLDSTTWCGSRVKHLDFIEELETSAFVSAPFQQSIDGFIQCQHARATFNVPALGTRLAAFRDELAAMLHPYADQHGLLTFRVKSHLTLGKL